MDTILAQLFVRLARRIGGYNLACLALLLAAHFSAAYGIETAIRRLPEAFLISAGSLGLIAGWLLSRRLRGAWMLVWAILLGAAWNLLAAGNLIPLLFRIPVFGLGLLTQGWPWRVDWIPFVELLSLFVSGAAAVLARLVAWLQGWQSGPPAFEPVAAAIVWGFACWLSAAWSAWWVQRRRQPVAALLPSAFLLAAVSNYTRSPVLPLVALLAVMWILVGSVEYYQREQRWQVQHLDYSDELRFDLSVIVISLSVSTAVIGGLLPSISIQPAVRLVRRLVQPPPPEGLPQAASLGLESGISADKKPLAFGSGGLPRQHLLGSGPELSEQTVFTVTTDDPPAAGGSQGVGQAGRQYYWRGLVYDRYTGRGWLTSDTTPQDYPPGETTVSAQLQAGRRMVLQVEGRADLNNLVYAAGWPLRSDRPLTGLWRTLPDGSTPGDWFAFTTPDNSYRLVTLLPLAGENELRQAAAPAPPEILERYLQLPAELPARLRHLALDLTGTQANVYDQARAIESYLRSFPYTLDVSAPPAGVDVADYFLFDLRQGYCDYTATAMVVLARAAGLPARLAAGYAAGEYEPAAARYQVSEADAHSWPEIYFPAYGWIAFEPTSGRDAVELPASASPQERSPAQEAAALELPPAPITAGEALLAFARRFWPQVALLSILATGLIWLAGAAWRTQRLDPEQAVIYTYPRLLVLANRLQAGLPASYTPHEAAQALQVRLHKLASAGVWQRLLSPLHAELERWLFAYTRSIYGPPPLPPDVPRQALESWRRLRWRLWLARLRLPLKWRKR